MNQQPSLFYGKKIIEVKKKSSIEERFEIFDASNPHIYLRLKSIALDLKRRGRKKYGVKALFEKLRWDFNVSTDAEKYKLSNDFTSSYARKLMNENNELKGFFNVKKKRQ